MELVGILRENEWTEDSIQEMLKSLVFEDWWSSKSQEQQAAYIKAHPKSQKAQQAKKNCRFQKERSCKRELR